MPTILALSMFAVLLTTNTPSLIHQLSIYTHLVTLQHVCCTKAYSVELCEATVVYNRATVFLPTWLLSSEATEDHQQTVADECVSAKTGYK